MKQLEYNFYIVKPTNMVKMILWQIKYISPYRKLKKKLTNCVSIQQTTILKI